MNDNKEINEILKSFYDKSMNPESRKFTLLLLTKFIPTSMKKDTLKSLIDSLDDESVNRLTEMLIDAFSSDEMAEKIREMVDKQKE